MDGRTDGRTELRQLRRAESIAAFARKNEKIKVKMKTLSYTGRLKKYRTSYSQSPM